MWLRTFQSINDRRQERQAQKAAEQHAQELAAAEEEYRNSNAGINAAYQNQADKTSRLYDSIQSQQSEVGRLKEQQKQAEEAVSKNCSGSNDTSAMCQAARNSLSATESLLQDKEKELENTQKEYEAAKEALEESYNNTLNSNLSKAEEDYEAAQSKADGICAVNPGSAECSAARQEALDAANLVMSLTNEKENGTGDSRYRTSEDVVNTVVAGQEERERKQMEDLLAYEEEKDAQWLENEAALADQQYQQAQDEVNTLYTQMNAMEQEIGELESDVAKKKQAAADACAKDPSGSVCSTARIDADAAEFTLNNKNKQLDQAKNDYNNAKEKAEDAYQNSLKANQNQAQRDYDNAQEQAEDAQKQLDEINSQIDDAASAANTAKGEYDEAVADAQAAKKAYEQAVAEGKSPEEIENLEQAYEDTLTVMSDKKKAADEKNKEYWNLSQQQKQAEDAYNDAYSQASDAADRLASYTNEDVNQTGDSRLNSSEDIDNQLKIDQFLSETSPAAMAQSAKNNYIEQKNKTDAAKNSLTEKQGNAEQTRIAYEEATARCQQSGDTADCRLADRLKSNYELAANEVTTAQQEYDSLKSSLGGYEQNYLQTSLDAAKNTRQTSEAAMKQAADDINQYEVSVSRQRTVVEQAATVYTQARNNLTPGDQDALRRAAQLYETYKEAKTLYDEYQAKLRQANNNYAKAQSDYQTAESEIARLEKELKGS